MADPPDWSSVVRSVTIDEWVEAVHAGKLQLQDRGAAVSIPHLMHIRDAFSQSDQDDSGYINFSEFHALHISMDTNKAVNGRDMARIWKQMAEETEDVHVEIVCRIDNYLDWELDPELQVRFEKELLAQLAKYCDVSVKILSVAAVLKGEFARMQAVKNMHTKIESKLKKVSSDAIATVTIMIESVSANRLRTACVVGDADEVRRELAKGVDPNEEVSVSPAAAAALPLCLPCNRKGSGTTRSEQLHQMQSLSRADPLNLAALRLRRICSRAAYTSRRWRATSSASRRCWTAAPTQR